MQIKLAYGRDGLTVNLPDTTHIIESGSVPAVPDEAVAVRNALRHPIASAPLAQKVAPGNKVAIVHSDITRATPNDRILPVLLAELEAAGVSSQDITLLKALGTHRTQTEAELRTMLGDQIVDNYRCLQHNAFDDECLISLGETSSGCYSGRGLSSRSRVEASRKVRICLESWPELHPSIRCPLRSNHSGCYLLKQSSRFWDVP